MVLYQDYEKGVLCKIDVENMLKALRLEWIPRLLKNGHVNWKNILGYLVKKYGGLGFLISCTCPMKDLEYLPRFAKTSYSF